MLVSKGTMVDATIVHAPSSTKNQNKARDSDMYQTKKGNQKYFGMKIHVGADVNSGAVHNVTVTAANTADIVELPTTATPATTRKRLTPSAAELVRQQQA